MEQVEDEIAALNAALGAAYAGARAATGSSGGGLSLMTEAIGLAGITETPVVIVDAQRPGPATGMATRTEQSDLLFIVHASQGEFPRVVLSPADHDDAFYLTAEAFNLAERWQVPVFILVDQAFADAQRSVPEFDLSSGVDRSGSHCAGAGAAGGAAPIPNHGFRRVSACVPRDLKMDSRAGQPRAR